MFRIFFLCLVVVAPLNAAVIGVSQPAQSITPARIATLPKGQRAAWLAYLKRSKVQMQQDKAGLAAERKPGAPIPPMPKEAFSGRSMPLHRDAAWYGTPEARHIADVILSFQTPAGGWSKNLAMDQARLPGQSYTTNNLSRFLTPGDFDAPHDPNWNYVGTLDNDATNTELHFLALVSGQTPGPAGNEYRASFLRGVRYLLDAQFPNGGWPQVWPLEGGYHDAITFNDNAVTESAETLTNVAQGQGDYAFVPANLRGEAGAVAAHALQCILATQIVINGRKTVWAQQHDALTLQPVSGRNFEPEAFSSGESSDVLVYLMSLPHPSAAVIGAVNAGVAWLKQAAIYGEDWTGGRRSPGGRHLVAKPGAGPIWARYYSLSTEKPVFGDRDKTIHDDVNDLSIERRNGYSWFSTGPQQALDAYAEWSKTHALPAMVK
ncbi:pectate lyase [Edaphobacter sp.]|uniref:pectate lyase n=1 Tax=Edaphobacter sp. TaxID=1934404 RepID=UPI002DB68047|nr:pectate lyase [Edaphobacter sp.]HEU5340286.1 pectate lyase [Edaphobacter sp.]